MQRRHLYSLVATVGLLGLIGCESTIFAGSEPAPLDPVVPPADQIIVSYAATPDEGANPGNLGNATVTVYSGSTVIQTIDLPATAGTAYTDTIKNLNNPVTYRIVVTQAAHYNNSETIRLEGTSVPRVGITISAIVNDVNTIVEVVLPTVGEKTVSIPDNLDEFAVTGTVGITLNDTAANAVSGSMTIAATTAGNMAATTAGVAALSGLVINFDQVNDLAALAETELEVSVPLPLDAEDLAQSAGAEVPIYRLDPVTLTWDEIGEGTIDADGTVTGNVTGLGQDNTISVQVPTTVTENTDTETELVGDEIHQSELADLLNEDNEYVADLNPALDVSTVGGKMASGVLARTAEGGAAMNPAWNISEAHWQIIKQVISVRIPELSPWLLGNPAVEAIVVPESIIPVVVKELKVISFDIALNVGNLNKVWVARAEYTKSRLRQLHTSGQVVTLDAF